MPRKRRSSYEYIMPLFYFKCDRSPLKVSPQIIIRKISQDELIFLENDLLTILTELEMQAIFYALERVTNSEKADETDKLFQQVTTAFRLLKAGPLYTKVIYIVRPNSSVRAKWTFKGIPPCPEYYILNRSDMKQLRNVMESLKRFDASKSRNKSLAIALNFFEKSYADDWETALVNCWTAFEALCLGGIKAGEAAGSTVSIAISLLLGKTRNEREHIRGFLRNAYKTRNDIVHGNERKSKDDTSMVKELQNYLRMSIVKLLD